MLAEELYNNLKKEDILSSKGKINFELLNIKTVVKTKSVVGDVIQDWLQNYLEQKNYNFDVPGHTQEFPDFFLNRSNVQELLEVKCFDGNKSANFDVANFEAYCQSLLTRPERLDSYYLIFAYSMNEANYEVSIKNFWLKRVWEITGPSADWPVKFQIKKGMIYNIRPSTWYSDKAKFKPFQDRKDFVDALAQCIRRYHSTNHLHKSGWLESVKSGYETATGEKL